MKTYGYRALGDIGALEVIDQPEPEPRAGEVVIEVEVVGVNRLDLYVLSDAAPGARPPLPFVPGIDPSGRVVAVGDGVDMLEPGARVVAKPNVACLRCEECLGGRPWACRRQTIIGVHCPGGFAPRVAIPATNAIPLPPGITFGEATAAVHSFPVALRMIKEAGGVTPGMRVVVIGGAGGVGSAAVQLCRRLGASVVAVVGGDRKAGFVAELGATPIDHLGGGSPADAILAATEGEGPDLIIDTAGAPLLTSAALATLAWRGGYVVCGTHGGGRVDLDLATLYRKRQRIVGSSASGYDDVREVLADLAGGGLRAQIDSVLAMPEATRAYEALRSRSNLGKILLEHGRE